MHPSSDHPRAARALSTERRLRLLVPILSERDPIEALVPLARACAGSDDPEVSVLRIEDLPVQAPPGLLLECYAQTLTRFWCASEGCGPNTSLGGIVTQQGATVLRELATDPATRWVVMGWRSTSLLRRLFDPIARFVAQPSADLLLYRPADSRSEAASAPLQPRRMLVLTSHSRQDATLLRLAARLATRCPESRITVCSLAEVGSLHDLRDDLGRIAPPGTTIWSERICSSDPAHAVAQHTRSQDLLILGDGTHSLGDRIVAKARCAVLHVRTASPTPGPEAPP